MELEKQIINEIHQICIKQNFNIDKNSIKKHLTKLLEGEVDIFAIDICQRLKDIVALKRDSSSKKSYILRYGEKLGLIKWREKTDKTICNRQKYITLYGEEEATKRLKSKGASLDNYIIRYGEELRFN